MAHWLVRYLRNANYVRCLYREWQFTSLRKCIAVQSANSYRRIAQAFGGGTL